MVVVMSTFCGSGVVAHNRYKSCHTNFGRDRGRDDRPIRGRYRVGYSSIFCISLAKYDISVQPGTATLPECMNATVQGEILFILIYFNGLNGRMVVEMSVSRGVLEPVTRYGGLTV